MKSPHDMAVDAYNSTLPAVPTPIQLDTFETGKVAGVAFLEAVIYAAMHAAVDAAVAEAVGWEAHWSGPDSDWRPVSTRIKTLAKVLFGEGDVT